MERRDDELLANIKAKLPVLSNLLADMNGHWAGEDGIYRFYHHSFKVHLRLQPYIKDCVKHFEEMLPGATLNPMFKQIVDEALTKKFSMADNQNWMAATRVLPEAFFHCKYFLEQIVKYGTELDKAPNSLPSGWASVLYLWNIR